MKQRKSQRVVSRGISIEKARTVASIEMLEACVVMQELLCQAILVFHARYVLLLLQSEGTSPRITTVVRPEGLEPPTPRSVVWCSIH